MLQFYILLKRYLIIAVGLIVLFSTANSQTETGRTVSISLDNTFTMVKTDKQKNLLQKIKERETTASIKIFKVENISEMINSTSLRFDDKIFYSISSGEDKQSKGNNLWQGKPDEAEANMTTLIFSEDDVTGSIWLNGKLYKIEPLGDGIHAFIENDQSKSLSCPQPIEIKEDDNGDESLYKSDAIQTDPPVIEVLVAYTTA